MDKAKNFDPLFDEDQGEQTTFSTLKGTFIDAIRLMKTHFFLAILVIVIFSVGSLGLSVLTYDEVY